MAISFFRTITSSQQLFFQNSYFFRAKLLRSSHYLRIRRSLGQFLFGTATFLEEELLRMKMSVEDLLFQSRFFCTESQVFLLHFGKRRIFQKSNIPHYLFFLERHLFRAAIAEKVYFFKRCYLLQQLPFFRSAIFYDMLFQKNYHITATLFFDSCSSYLSVSN